MDGYKLRVERDKRKLTLLQVYTETGVDPATINRIENGKNKNPSYTLVKKLCLFFEIKTFI